jgi:hypothetical protein
VTAGSSSGRRRGAAPGRPESTEQDRYETTVRVQPTYPAAWSRARSTMSPMTIDMSMRWRPHSGVRSPPMLSARGSLGSAVIVTDTLGPAAAQPAPVVPAGSTPRHAARGDVTGRAETFAQATVSFRLFPGRSQAPLRLRSLDVIMATQTLPASPDGIGGVRQATFSTPSARTLARPCSRPLRRIPSATPFASTNAPTARWRRGPWWPRWWPRPCPARPTSPLATARHWRRPRAAHRHRRRARIRTASRRHDRGIDHPASTAPAVAGAGGTPPAAALAGGSEP